MKVTLASTLKSSNGVPDAEHVSVESQATFSALGFKPHSQRWARATFYRGGAMTAKDNPGLVVWRLVRKSGEQLGFGASRGRASLLALALLWSLTLLAPLPAHAVDSSPDLEVRLARTLYFLQVGAYEAAREETRTLLGSDTSLRARYYHGVACARLEDWTCALAMLGEVEASDKAGWFEQLPLELGVALMQKGHLKEARRQLRQAKRNPATTEAARAYLDALDRLESATEAMDASDAGRYGPSSATSHSAGRHGPSSATSDSAGRYGPSGATPTSVGRYGPSGVAGKTTKGLRLGASIGTGFDSNISGRVNDSGATCGPNEVGDEEVPRSCGLAVTEQVGVDYFTRIGGLRAQAGYVFLHRWYPNIDPTWPEGTEHLYDVQDHRLGAALTLPEVGLSLVYGLVAESLNLHYRPLYYLGNQVTMRYRHVGSLEWGAEGRVTLDRFGDLTEIWLMTPQALGGCAGDDAALEDSGRCIKGEDGWRPRAGLFSTLRRRTFNLRASIAGELLRPADTLYRGYQLQGMLSGAFQPSRRLTLEARWGGGFRRYSDPLGPGYVRQLYPALDVHYHFTRWLTLSARYRANWSRVVTSPDSDSSTTATDESLSEQTDYLVNYVRHTALLEVRYVR